MAPVIGVHGGLLPHVFGNRGFTLRRRPDGRLSLPWPGIPRDNTSVLSMVLGEEAAGRAPLSFASGSSEPSEEDDSSRLDRSGLQINNLAC